MNCFNRQMMGAAAKREATVFLTGILGAMVVWAGFILLSLENPNKNRPIAKQVEDNSLRRKDRPKRIDDKLITTYVFWGGVCLFSGVVVVLMSTGGRRRPVRTVSGYTKNEIASATILDPQRKKTQIPPRKRY